MRVRRAVRERHPLGKTVAAEWFTVRALAPPVLVDVEQHVEVVRGEHVDGLRDPVEQLLVDDAGLRHQTRARDTQSHRVEAVRLQPRRVVVVEAGGRRVVRRVLHHEVRAAQEHDAARRVDHPTTDMANRADGLGIAERRPAPGASGWDARPAGPRECHQCEHEDHRRHRVLQGPCRASAHPQILSDVGACRVRPPA